MCLCARETPCIIAACHIIYWCFLTLIPHNHQSFTLPKDRLCANMP